ncbi:hypothetical protein FNU76_02195 [Chitinimonas arctica]|uniref:ABC transporter substrate-binding protein n=1 Tax=Chitinimonas arctica TaxID=2594795 RepID=A0A516SAR7_9NEIS|nr:ABC transporter substrate binding protein [Chitinimonas arctica]QDQ25257.1 hypothetical protein FNU76_02195 [Chitinimonas arctica]
MPFHRPRRDGSEGIRRVDVRRATGLAMLALWLIAGFGTYAAAHAAAHTAEPRNRHPTLAVLYDRADEYAPNAFQQILSGIFEHPDVALYRLKSSARQEQAMMLAASTGGGFLKVAAYSAGNIAVLYPDIGEPYRSVFSKIIEGIEDKTKVRVASFAIGSNLNQQELNGELKRQNVRVVIALGRNGLRAAAALDRATVNIVAGGVLAVPENEARGISVHSLAPDPELLFIRLKLLSPQAKRVFVVYDPRNNGWLIQLARQAAKAQGLELQVREAGDLKTAMQHYQAILSASDAHTDALWLPQDGTTVEESAVLPLVLQGAWNRNLVVFSSSLGHVKRGILFSLYPDNLGLGRQLAHFALGQLAGNAEAAEATRPLKEVLLAVNLRTASHLGLNLSNKQQQSFDLIFPEP